MSERAIFAGLLFLAALAGCAEQAATPALNLDPNGVSPRVDYADLSAVLSKAVTNEGKIDSYDLKKVADRLDSQLKLLAVTGPTATPALLPTDQDKLAYWYNARCAWSIKLAMLYDCPKELPAAAIEGRPVPLDGRMMTLDQVDAILSADADWRVAALAPSVRMNRAAMPREAFSPSAVREQLPQRLTAYIGDDNRFNIDIERRTVCFPPVLWQFRQRLIGEYNSTYHTRGVTTLTTAMLPMFQGLPMVRLQGAVGFADVESAAGGALACVKHW